jgi:hypothetical protein
MHASNDRARATPGCTRGAAAAAARVGTAQPCTSTSKWSNNGGKLCRSSSRL